MLCFFMLFEALIRQCKSWSQTTGISGLLTVNTVWSYDHYFWRITSLWRTDRQTDTQPTAKSCSSIAEHDKNQFTTLMFAEVTRQSENDNMHCTLARHKINATYEWSYERIQEDFCWLQRQLDLTRQLNTDINTINICTKLTKINIQLTRSLYYFVGGSNMSLFRYGIAGFNVLLNTLFR